MKILPVATALFLLLAPAAAQQSPLSRDWKRLQATDLEVVGDAPEEDLQRTLEYVEAFRSTLKSLIPSLDVTSHQKTVLVAFRRPGWFKPFPPRDRRGRPQRFVTSYFAVRPHSNVMVLPVYGTHEISYLEAFHDYTLYLIHRNVRNVPAWLQVGLAEFYSTFAIESNGRRIIGRAPPGHLDTLRLQPMFSHSQFLDPLDSRLAARVSNTGSGAQVYYAQAWAFVHFMMLSDKGSRQGQLLNFVERLQTAPNQAEAARQAFGTDLSRLDADLRRYIGRDQFPTIVVPPPAVKARRTAGPLHAMTEADARYLQGCLLVDVGACEQAGSVLAKAIALHPGHLGAGVALARVRLHDDRASEALELLQAVAADAPDDFAAQHYLASALDEVGRHEESVKAFDRAVAMNPRSPDGWFGLSLATLSLGRDIQSDAAMRHAQNRYPDPSWYSARARHALGAGRNDVAARDSHAYLTAAGWLGTGTPYAAFVGAIAHQRLQQEAEAAALLSAAEKAVPQNSWQATIARYLQGQLGGEAFLDRADDEEERTEARTYMGLRALLAGRTDEARQHFEWVRERGDRNYSEYRMAVAELKRLHKQPLSSTGASQNHQP
jgi:tetratricopeptide (TPR) repeat protein